MGETRVEHQFFLRTCFPVDRRDIRQSVLCRFSSRLHGMVVPFAGHTGARGARAQERFSRGHMEDPSLDWPLREKNKGFQSPRRPIMDEVQHGLSPAALKLWAGILSM